MSGSAKSPHNLPKEDSREAEYDHDHDHGDEDAGVIENDPAESHLHKQNDSEEDHPSGRSATTVSSKAKAAMHNHHHHHHQQQQQQQQQLHPQSGATGSSMETDSVTAPCLVARIDNARVIYQLLKAIHLKDRAVCVITQRGFKFTVEDAKSVQAHSYLQESLFQEFAFTEEELIFGINLATLTECLNIFGAGSGVGPVVPVTLRITCLGQGHPLVLLLEEGRVTTKCKISTFEPDMLVDFDFRGVPIVNKIIMKSEWLKEAFEEMDPTSELLNIIVSPSAPYFRLSTEGPAGSIEMDYPKENDVIESFQCEQIQVNCYRLSLVLPSVKALALSKKTSLRTNKRGVLSMQYMISVTETITSFVEYFCMPVETESDSQTSA